MRLIVGLGNPLPKYFTTFHNVGFMAIDTFADTYGVSFTENKKLKSLVGEITVNNEKTIIIKPLTYMNLSGEAVSLAVSYYKIPTENVMVVYDDLDINIGSVRIRKNGSAGTHNGMRNIVLNIGQEFPRYRIGTKPTVELSNVPILDYVLMNIPKTLMPIYENVYKDTAKALFDFCSGVDIEKIMHDHNGEIKD